MRRLFAASPPSLVLKPLCVRIFVLPRTARGEKIAQKLAARLRQQHEPAAKRKSGQARLPVCKRAAALAIVRRHQNQMRGSNGTMAQTSNVDSTSRRAMRGVKRKSEGNMQQRNKKKISRNISFFLRSRRHIAHQYAYAYSFSLPPLRTRGSRGIRCALRMKAACCVTTSCRDGCVADSNK